MKKIVTIGGGTGQYTLLSGLKHIKDIKITAIASMVDSGGSSGRLRAEFGVLPPSDIYRCVLALSPYSDKEDIRELLLFRFPAELKKLGGHTVGNMLLTGSSEFGGDFLEAVKALSLWLKIQGQVLPVTLEKVHLVAISKKGVIYPTEEAIGARDESSPLEKVFLVPQAKAYDLAREEILRADLIVIGPGDLFTSLIVNFLVEGIAKAVQNSKAKLVYLLNNMTRFAETDGFKASDHVKTLERYVGRKMDFVLCNTSLPAKIVLKKYEEEKAFPVQIDIENEWEGRKVIKANLLASGSKMARHDPAKLAPLVASLAD